VVTFIELYFINFKMYIEESWEQIKGTKGVVKVRIGQIQ